MIDNASPQIACDLTLSLRWLRRRTHFCPANVPASVALAVLGWLEALLEIDLFALPMMARCGVSVTDLTCAADCDILHLLRI